jgi:alpha-beta hydrolase superfamily lysophospholipase
MLSYDQRGHGHRDGKRGHIPSFEKAMDDIDHFLADARQKAPGKPVILYGHSMGGLEVLFHTLTRRPTITGVICSSPGLAAGDIAPTTLFAAKVMNILAPAFTLPNGLDVNNLSTDPEVVRKYQADPLATGMVSARLGMEIINTGPWVIEHAPEFTLPLLLMQGTADHIVSPPATRQFAGRTPKTLVTHREWEGLCHELHNEPQKDQVIQAMFTWIDQNIGV